MGRCLVWVAVCGGWLRVQEVKAVHGDGSSVYSTLYGGGYVPVCGGWLAARSPHQTNPPDLQDGRSGSDDILPPQ